MKRKIRKLYEKLFHKEELASLKLKNKALQNVLRLKSLDLENCRRGYRRGEEALKKVQTEKGQLIGKTTPENLTHDILGIFLKHVSKKPIWTLKEANKCNAELLQFLKKERV